MLLSIKERLILLNILPTQETYANMLLIRNLVGEIGFSAIDHLEVGFVDDDAGNVSWEPEKDYQKEVPIGISEYALIKKGFKKLDGKGEITNDLIDTYKRFVEDEVEVLPHAEMEVAK